MEKAEFYKKEEKIAEYLLETAKSLTEGAISLESFKQILVNVNNNLPKFGFISDEDDTLYEMDSFDLQMQKEMIDEFLADLHSADDLLIEGSGTFLRKFVSEEVANKTLGYSYEYRTDDDDE